MKRLHVWLCLSAAGLLYWGVVHRFASSQVEHFTGPVWFGGIALLLHWFTNRNAGVQGIDGPRRGPVADGSQKPNDAAAIPCAKAGSTAGVHPSAQTVAQRAADLHEKAGMPLDQARELASAEADITPDNQWLGDMMILQVLADSEHVNEQEREVLTRWMAASQPPGVPGIPQPQQVSDASMREIDLALAAMADLKPLVEYGQPGAYDTVQARRKTALLRAERSLLYLRRELAAKDGVPGAGKTVDEGM